MRSRFRPRARALPCLALGLLLAACNGDFPPPVRGSGPPLVPSSGTASTITPEPTSLGQQCQQPARTLILGVLLEGTAASVVESRRAIELAASHAARLCPPVQLTVRTEDGQGDVAFRARRLLAAGVQALLIADQPEAASTAAALASEHGIPVLSTDLPGGGQGSGLGFSLALSAAERSRQTVARVAERMEPRTVALLVAAHDPVSRAEGAAMRAALDAAGVPVVSEQQPVTEDNDYRAALTAIKRTKPDVLFIAAPTDAAIRIVSQTRELGIKSPIAGGSGFTSLEIPRLTGDAAEGIIVATSWSPARPATAPLTSRYQSTYGSVPGEQAALAYAAVQALAQAAGHAERLDSEGVRLALASTEAQTILGPVRFTDDGRAQYPASIHIIKAGKLTFWP